MPFGCFSDSFNLFWSVPEIYCRPGELYKNNNIDLKKLRKLIKDGKLAPCFPGAEEATPTAGPDNRLIQSVAQRVLRRRKLDPRKLQDALQDYESCPICFLHYPLLNTSKCCGKRVCTECFIQVQTSGPNHHALPACPFCKVPGYTAKFIGIRTMEEKEEERVEEQKVIEARIREREEEIARDAERERQRHEQQHEREAAAVAAATAGEPSPAPTQQPAPHLTERTSISTSVRPDQNQADPANVTVDLPPAPRDVAPANPHESPQQLPPSTTDTGPSQATPGPMAAAAASAASRHPHTHNHNHHYRLADYVPTGVVDMSQEVSVDDINELMLEQAMFESIAAAATARQRPANPAPRERGDAAAGGRERPGHPHSSARRSTQTPTPSRPGAERHAAAPRDGHTATRRPATTPTRRSTAAAEPTAVAAQSTSRHRSQSGAASSHGARPMSGRSHMAVGRRSGRSGSGNTIVAALTSQTLARHQAVHPEHIRHSVALSTQATDGMSSAENSVRLSRMMLGTVSLEQVTPRVSARAPVLPMPENLSEEEQLALAIRMSLQEVQGSQQQQQLLPQQEASQPASDPLRAEAGSPSHKPLHHTQAEPEVSKDEALVSRHQKPNITLDTQPAVPGPISDGVQSPAGASTSATPVGRTGGMEAAPAAAAPAATLPAAVVAAAATPGRPEPAPGFRQPLRGFGEAESDDEEEQALVSRRVQWPPLPAMERPATSPPAFAAVSARSTSSVAPVLVPGTTHAPAGPWQMPLFSPQSPISPTLPVFDIAKACAVVIAPADPSKQDSAATAEAAPVASSSPPPPPAAAEAAVSTLTATAALPIPIKRSPSSPPSSMGNVSTHVGSRRGLLISSHMASLGGAEPSQGLAWDTLNPNPIYDLSLPTTASNSVVSDHNVLTHLPAVLTRAASLAGLGTPLSMNGHQPKASTHGEGAHPHSAAAAEPSTSECLLGAMDSTPNTGHMLLAQSLEAAPDAAPGRSSRGSSVGVCACASRASCATPSTPPAAGPMPTPSPGSSRTVPYGALVAQVMAAGAGEQVASSFTHDGGSASPRTPTYIVGMVRAVWDTAPGTSACHTAGVPAPVTVGAEVAEHTPLDAAVTMAAPAPQREEDVAHLDAPPSASPEEQKPYEVSAWCTQLHLSPSASLVENPDGSFCAMVPEHVAAPPPPPVDPMVEWDRQQDEQMAALDAAGYEDYDLDYEAALQGGSAGSVRAVLPPPACINTHLGAGPHLGPQALALVGSAGRSSGGGARGERDVYSAVDGEVLARIAQVDSDVVGRVAAADAGLRATMHPR